MTSIREIVDNYNGEDKDTLIRALEAREEAGCDVLRLAGMQFGLFPQIVSGVLLQAGLGAPMSEEEQTMIRSNFDALMEEIRRAQGGGGSGV